MAENTVKNSRPRIIQRIANMATAWSIIGILVGIDNGLHIGGAIGLISQIIAGIIVLSTLGMILGLVFDRGCESIIGGALGIIVGISIEPLHSIEIQVEPISLYIIMGALIGATIWPIISLIKRIATNI